MDINSYYDVACNDLEVLDFNMKHIDEVPNYNQLVVHAQQVAEKLLKHLIKPYPPISW